MAFLITGRTYMRKTQKLRAENTLTKRIPVSSELTYILAIILLALAVAILTTADFGISMIVAPAYLLSLKVGVITFSKLSAICTENCSAI